jgi:hypothetical protein
MSFAAGDRLWGHGTSTAAVEPETDEDGYMDFSQVLDTAERHQLPLHVQIRMAAVDLYAKLNAFFQGTTKDFDGNWDVTLNCPPTGKAQGFTRALSATIANGVFHADAQSQGAVNRLEIDGQIPADGKTTLSARGTTGASTYTLNNLAPGSPYAFTVDAQFDRARGTGKRNEARACGLVFVKR